jgi:CRP/FNR family transcriptional regulator
MQDIGCGCERCLNKLCTKRVPIFSVLDEDELNKISPLIIRRKYSKGEFVLMEGDLLDSLIIINQGRIKTFRYTPEVREQILYIFSEGDFFGEMNLLSKEQPSYNAEALEDTNVCMIHKEDFQELLRRLIADPQTPLSAIKAVAAITPGHVSGQGGAAEAQYSTSRGV